MTGTAAWTAGVAVFIATIAWTIRDALAGGETGTGDGNAERRRVNRVANAAAPVALAYLAVGSYGVLAHYAYLPGRSATFRWSPTSSRPGRPPSSSSALGSDSCHGFSSHKRNFLSPRPS